MKTLIFVAAAVVLSGTALAQTPPPQPDTPSEQDVPPTPTPTPEDASPASPTPEPGTQPTPTPEQTMPPAPTPAPEQTMPPAPMPTPEEQTPPTPMPAPEGQTPPTPSTAPEPGGPAVSADARPERDARGIPVVSESAMAPAGANQTSGSNPGSAVFASRPSDKTYKACTRQVTDGCVQTYERGREPN